MTQIDPARPTLDATDALSVGTRVAEFELKRVLGSGGFGIVYLAWDHALEREVALKEYMPSNLAGRGAGLLVTLRTAAAAETFHLGLRSFVNEGRLLARFDHPSLVKVYRFWEDNGTAYMVMPYYRGRTLRQVRAGMIVPPGEAACRRVLDALLSALEVLHGEGVYHRDIAPDNILLGDDGAPVLLDFGAARRVIGDGPQALTSILKPHFAPLEQYADAGSLRQGPWTDLYALGGTIYFLITGQAPVAAASRALHDDQPRLAALRPDGCSPGFLAAIDWMLALRPAERPQSVQMLRDVLDGRMAQPGQLRHDNTAPGVAARAPAASGAGAPASTDFDPTVVHAGASAPGPALPARAEPAARAVAGAAGAIAPAGAAPASRDAGRRPGLSRRTHVLLLALLLLGNVMAWWWVARAPTVPGPAASAAVDAAPMAATTAAPGAAAVPAERIASEVILSVLPAQVRPEARPASAPALRTRPADVAAAPTEAALVLAPSARCGDRQFLLKLICMKSECDRPELRTHPECVRMREQEESGRTRTPQ